MKLKKIYIVKLLIFGGFCFSSCAEKKDKSGVWSSTENSEISLFDVTQSSSYQIVKLETNEHSLVGGYDRVLANDQYLYIFDKEKKSEVNIFTQTGEFVRKISSKGRGPSEYIFINDITLSEEHLILLDSRLRKILYFSFAGEFVKEIQQDGYRGMTFTSINDNQFAYYMHTNGMSADNEEVLIVNNKGDILEGLIPRKGLTELQGRFGMNPYFASTEKGLYFIPVFEDKIYQWENGKMKAVYDFEIGDKQMKFQDVTEMPIETSGKIEYIGSFFITNQEVFTCLSSLNKKVIDVCGSIRDNTLFRWSGNFTVKGTYKQFFITHLNVELAKEMGLKVDENADDNDVLVFVDGNNFIERVKQFRQK